MTIEDSSNTELSKLKALGVRQVIPLHCTGKSAVDIVRKIYGDSCISLCEGQFIEI
jgi:hypothetical protein